METSYFHALLIFHLSILIPHPWVQSTYKYQGTLITNMYTESIRDVCKQTKTQIKRLR